MIPIEFPLFKGFFTTDVDNQPRKVAFVDYTNDVSANTVVSNWMPAFNQECTISVVQHSRFATETLYGSGWDPIMPQIVHALRFWSNEQQDTLVNTTDVSNLAAEDGDGDFWFVKTWNLKKYTKVQLSTEYPDGSFNPDIDGDAYICDEVTWANTNPGNQKEFICAYAWVVYEPD